ncbi:MAG: hypothetical protein J0J01_13560 [Reyranella sp.]|uniref:hypothetical protein n=1 Tax=Reyranella sp. TaxID=1929291 RepID=UPI001AC556F4|nr:hypothetical protein [Reyranella sp.]MBN9087933.1 hypothetical protein [Reyranella sp.]
MRSILKSRWTMGAVAAAAATLGLVATTTGAEAAYCAHWRHGYCVDWRNSGYTYDPGPAAALNAFAGIMGAAVAASQPRYYYPPPAYGYYAPPPPAYRYYAPPPAYGYYGPEPGYGLMIR